MIGKKLKGFTLIELMVVLLIISILAGVVAPVVTKSIVKAREAALKDDLKIMRKVLDDYYADNGHYPKYLQELVDKHYIRSIPNDPFTKKEDTWQTTLDQDGDVSDIHSGYDGQSSNGRNYSDW